MYPAEQLLLMKEKLLKKVLRKEMKICEVAELVGVTRQSVSKWLAKYWYGGIAELVPQKAGTCWYRTSEEIAKEHFFKCPV